MNRSRGRGGGRRGRGNNGSSTTKVPLKGLFSDGVWKCTPTEFPCNYRLLSILKLITIPQAIAIPASRLNISRLKTAVKTTAAGSIHVNSRSQNAAISSSGAMKQRCEKLLLS